MTWVCWERVFDEAKAAHSRPDLLAFVRVPDGVARQDIAPDFLKRFECYEVIGRDTPFAATEMRSLMVYAPAGLDYSWHHHPTEAVQ